LVGKTTHNNQVCLMFALRDNGGDEVVDDPKNFARE
jgi:hypothetical protein